jgi:hypothetical protein
MVKQSGDVHENHAPEIIHLGHFLHIHGRGGRSGEGGYLGKGADQRGTGRSVHPALEGDGQKIVIPGNGNAGIGRKRVRRDLCVHQKGNGWLRVAGKMLCMGAEYMTRAISSTTEAALRHGPDRALAFGRHLFYLVWVGRNTKGFCPKEE